MNIEGVQVRYFPRITGDHSHLSPALLWALWQHCREFDVVHIHSWWNLVAMPALLICWMRGVRPVLSPRGMLSDYTFRSGWKRLFHNVLGRNLLAQSVVHVTSKVEREEVKKAAPDATVFEAPNLLQFPALASYSSVGKTLQIAFISRIDPKKGLAPLFHALQTSTFPWQLTIAGSGDAAYTAELKALAQTLGIAQQIEWVGWVDGPEKYRLLAYSDLFVLTSFSENFANAALEALAMGTPVLLGEDVGLADYVRQSNTGKVCAPAPEAIGAALDDLYKRIQEGAFKREDIARQVRTDFDPERIAEQYLDAYQTLS